MTPKQIYESRTVESHQINHVDLGNLIPEINGISYQDDFNQARAMLKLHHNPNRGQFGEAFTTSSLWFDNEPVAVVTMPHMPYKDDILITNELKYHDLVEYMLSVSANSRIT